MWNEAAPKADGARSPNTTPSTTPYDERRVVAWVGKSVIFKGELISSEDMTIDGRVEGTIEVRDHALTIGPDADIHADIVAKSVVVMGAVNGSITANEKVDIRESGSVRGDVLSPRLAIADGAVFDGRVETGIRRAQESRPSQLTIA
jgi:cytoskeletal protein CcmA (bactofilin family)